MYRSYEYHTHLFAQRSSGHIKPRFPRVLSHLITGSTSIAKEKAGMFATRDNRTPALPQDYKGHLSCAADDLLLQYDIRPLSEIKRVPKHTSFGPAYCRICICCSRVPSIAAPISRLCGHGWKYFLSHHMLQVSDIGCADT